MVEELDYDPRNYTKQHKEDSDFELLRVISWIGFAAFFRAFRGSQRLDNRASMVWHLTTVKPARALTRSFDSAIRNYLFGTLLPGGN